MKKGMHVLLTTILSATLVGCSSTTSTTSTTSTSSEADHLARIQEAGKITVATEGVWSPFTYHDETTDELVGFDVEVATAVAEKLGVEPEFKEVNFDGGLTGVAQGTFDMMANGVDVTDERSLSYDFTEAYAYDHAVIVTKTDTTDIKSFSDLNGKTTANSTGSTYAAMGEDNGATVTNVDTLGETMDLVLNGTVDATINANTSVQDYFNTTSNSDKLKVAVTDEETTEYAFPLKKGTDNDTLREAINKAIDELRSEGKLSEISTKYFGADITSE